MVNKREFHHIWFSRAGSSTFFMYLNKPTIYNIYATTIPLLSTLKILLSSRILYISLFLYWKFQKKKKKKTEWALSNHVKIYLWNRPYEFVQQIFFHINCLSDLFLCIRFVNTAIALEFFMVHASSKYTCTNLGSVLKNSLGLRINKCSSDFNNRILNSFVAYQVFINKI